jgi:hypothetical protein
MSDIQLCAHLQQLTPVPRCRRWSASILAPLGEREYIETDHTDWVQRDELDVAWYDDLQQNLRAVERKSSE